MKRELKLTLMVYRGRVHRVHTELPRADVRALMCGRSVEEGMNLLPSVFSICTHAHAAAAWGALMAAAGGSVDKNIKMLHTLAVQVETVQESLRSLTFQLPEELRDVAMMRSFAQAWRESNAFLSRLKQIIQSGTIETPDHYRTVLALWDEFCANHVFGDGSAVFLEKAAHTRSLSEFPPTPVLQWFRCLAQNAPLLGRAIISPLPSKYYRNGVLSWEELTAPPYEASCWLRVEQEPSMRFVTERFGNNVAARIAARMVDVARTLTILFGDYEGQHWIRSYQAAEHCGAVEVKCARGVLMHRARVENGEIVAYDICSPTDWNLHEKGALLTLVDASAQDRDRLHRHATWLVQALDPCVAFDIEIVGE
jgi:Coenzyme F420-reducing hydrogenase, alpha subunit